MGKVQKKLVKRAQKHFNQPNIFLAALVAQELRKSQTHKQTQSLTHTYQNFNFLSSLLANLNKNLGDSIAPTLLKGNVLKSQDYRVIWSQTVHFVTI